MGGLGSGGWGFWFGVEFLVDRVREGGVEGVVWWGVVGFLVLGLGFFFVLILVLLG